MQTEERINAGYDFILKWVLCVPIGILVLWDTIGAMFGSQPLSYWVALAFSVGFRLLAWAIVGFIKLLNSIDDYRE